MADTKKFLDAAGTTHLWSKIAESLNTKADKSEVSALDTKLGNLPTGKDAPTSFAAWIEKVATDAGSESAVTDLAGRISTIEGDYITSKDIGTAAASDVHNGAINKTGDAASTALPTTAQVISYVSGEVADLAGAMHFVGIKNSPAAITNPKAGDVVVISSTPATGYDASDEYIYNGSAWEKLGSEGVYATSAALSGVSDSVGAVAGRVSTLEGLHAKDGDKLKTVKAEIDTAITTAVGSTSVADQIAAEVIRANGAYDAKGAAAGVLGKSSDASTAATVYGAKAYADSLAKNYATSAQGSLAATALQPSDVIALTNSEIDTAITAAISKSTT